MPSEMWVSVLRIDLAIPGARSLKDRRQVVKSLKERLVARFEISCAEVGDAETWTRASLGITAFSNDRPYLQDLMDALVRYAGNDHGAMLGNIERDLFSYGKE